MSKFVIAPHFRLLVKTSPQFAESLLGSLAERLRLLTARLK